MGGPFEFVRVKNLVDGEWVVETGGLSVYAQFVSHREVHL